MRPLPLTEAMCRSPLRISTSLGTLISAAVTSAGPRTSRRMTTASSLKLVRTMSFRLRMMSVMSSVTPGMVSNSWSASSKRTAVMAAPGIDESSVRRSELPMVWPKPGSSGPTANRWRLLASSPIASTVGRWMTSMKSRGPFRDRLLRVQLDDELLADRHVDVIALRQITNSDLLASVARLEPTDEAAVEDVEVVLDDDHVASLLVKADDVALLHAEAGDVDALAVDEDLAVAHELARLRAGLGPAGAVHDVVEPLLEEAQQVLTGRSGEAVGLFIRATELPLEDAVDVLRLLLLLHLGEVLAAGVAT